MNISDLQKPFFLLIGLSFLFFWALDPASAGTLDAALEHTLQSLGPQDEVPVIIRAAGKTDLDLIQDRDKGVRRSKIIKALKSSADLSQKDLKEFLTTKDIKNIRSLWIIKGMALSATGDVIRKLATLPQVESVTLDAVVNAPAAIASTLAAPEWNINAITAPDLWDLGYIGGGVVVASMDTGVDADHPDLQNKWRGGANSWFDPNGQHTSPTDVNGHGTQTMGIMVGGAAGGTSIGVAPGAQWIAVKIFSDAGTTTYSAIHQGFQWLLDPDNNPDTNDAPDVVNNSWGLLDTNHGCITEFQPDVQTLKTAGIAVTFSAGNDGPSFETSLSPANYPDSFSVGAVDNTNTIMVSSSRGPSACGGDIFPYIVAPGADILTTDLYFGIPGAYTTVSGTSFTAPHLSGVMALLISAFPSSTVSELESAIRQSAFDLGVAGADNIYGYGLIDSISAYDLLASQPPAEPWYSLSGQTASSPALAWNPSANKLQMVVSASNSTLWGATFGPGGSFNNDWVNISGSAEQVPSLAWNPAANKMQMVVVASNGTIWSSTFNSSGVFNYDWVNIPGMTASPVALAWNPVANKMQMVVRTSNDTIWGSTFSSTGAFNNDWVNIPGLTASPVALAWNPVANEMQMVARASNNTMWGSTFNSSGVFNNDWVNIPGMTSDTPAIVWDDYESNIHMVVRASDNTLWNSTISSAGNFNNNWANFPGQSVSAPGLAYLPSIGYIEMVVRAADNSLWATSF